jgi:2-succinyl-5-enolpyruvyl-6-hydroxy-3-cyclohexene-1-carboxylate synthase
MTASEMTANAMTSTALARSIVQSCLDSGAEQVVIAPGSRNAPLSWAFAQAEKAGLIKIQVRIDERDAGFLALGIAKATKKPVPVVVTSGSAVANLMPAIVEAFHSAVPVVVLSADRPASVRGKSAPQTINQFGLFGTFVKSQIDVAIGNKSALDISKVINSTVSGRPGPVQVNVQFEMPLMPDVKEMEWRPKAPSVNSTSKTECNHKEIEISGHGIFVIGDNADPEAVNEISHISQEIGWPIVWEPTANAHMLPNAISHGVVLLQADVAPKVDVVVTLGTVGLSRAILGLLKSAPTHIAIHSATAGSDLPDPVSSANEILECVPKLNTKVDSEWLSQWQTLDSKAATSIAAALAPDTLSGPSAAQVVWNQAGEADQLFVAASWTVRHLEAHASKRKGLQVFGNRGANGIDGLISTATGVAIGTKKRTVLLMGDIAFLHDLGGLNLGEGQDQPNLTIVVLDNNGSGIFSQLEQGADEYKEHYEKVFGTPHGKDLWVIAESLGIPAKQVTTKTELKFALESFEKLPGIKVIVCLTGDRSAENDLIKQIVAQVKGS